MPTSESRSSSTDPPSVFELTAPLDQVSPIWRIKTMSRRRVVPTQAVQIRFHASVVTTDAVEADPLAGPVDVDRCVYPGPAVAILIDLNSHDGTEFRSRSQFRDSHRMMLPDSPE